MSDIFEDQQIQDIFDSYQSIQIQQENFIEISQQVLKFFPNIDSSKELLIQIYNKILSFRQQEDINIILVKQILTDIITYNQTGQLTKSVQGSLVQGSQSNIQGYRQSGPPQLRDQFKHLYNLLQTYYSNNLTFINEEQLEKICTQQNCQEVHQFLDIYLPNQKEFDILLLLDLLKDEIEKHREGEDQIIEQIESEGEADQQEDEELKKMFIMFRQSQIYETTTLNDNQFLVQTLEQQILYLKKQSQQLLSQNIDQNLQDFLQNINQFLKKLEINVLPTMAEQYNEIQILKIENEEIKSHINIESENKEQKSEIIQNLINQGQQYEKQLEEKDQQIQLALNQIKQFEQREHDFAFGGDFEHLQKTHNQYKVEIDNLTNENQSLTTEIKNLQKEYQILIKQSDIVKEQNQNLKSQLRQLEEVKIENFQMNKKLKQKENENREYQQYQLYNIKQVEEKNEQIRRDLANLRITFEIQNQQNDGEFIIHEEIEQVESLKSLNQSQNLSQSQNLNFMEIHQIDTLDTTPVDNNLNTQSQVIRKRENTFENIEKSLEVYDAKEHREYDIIALQTPTAMQQSMKVRRQLSTDFLQSPFLLNNKIPRTPQPHTQFNFPKDKNDQKNHDSNKNYGCHIF